jgi:DNA-binding NarL/FixJ family response regulator
LPKLFTLEIVRKLRSMGSPTKIVVVGVRSDRKTVLEALRSGANAYVLKSGPARHLMEAFQQVLDGGVYVSPMLEMSKVFTPEKENGDDPLEQLSAREFQVFSLLVDGTRAKEIAARLDLSPKTIDTYRASLMRKLDIHDVAGLVKFALQRNLTSVS